MKKEYKSEIYKDYAEAFKGATGLFNIKNSQSVILKNRYYFRGWFPEGKSAKIIELGCGDGSLIYALKGLGYKDIEGVDISPSQVDIARQIHDKIELGDALDYLKASQKKYDLIIALDIIEHLEKSEALEFITLCKEALTLDGRLIIQTPNAASPFFGSVRYGDLTHETAFTPQLLELLLHRAGFEDVESRETGPIPIGYSYLSSLRFAMWQILRSILCLYNMIETGSCGDKIFTRVFIQSAKVENR